MSPISKNRSTSFLVIVLFWATLFVGCNGAEAQPDLAASSVQIFAPADGAQLNVGDLLDVHTRVSDPEGGSHFSLIVNEQPIRQDELSTPMRSGIMYQPWRPVEPGTYTLQVIMLTSQGINQESNIVTVHVGGEQIAQQESPGEEGASSETVTPTPSSTPTPAISPAVFTADKNSNCRYGPSSAFDISDTILEKETVPIVGVGREPYQAYWYLEVNEKNCWVWSELGEPSGDYLNVPVIDPPPIPATATFTPTATPEPVSIPAPAPIGPSGTLNCAAVSGGTTLSWSAVSHPNGIDHYEWMLDGPTSESGSTGGTQASTAGLSCAGANYQWRVRAVDGQANIGPWSGFTSFNVP